MRKYSNGQIVYVPSKGYKGYVDGYQSVMNRYLIRIISGSDLACEWVDEFDISLSANESQEDTLLGGSLSKLNKSMYGHD